MKSGFVSFLGRPNAGKSTLLNRIVGHKLAIVSDKPQTTRTRIVGVKNYDAGQVVFVDTPGVHKPTHRMNVRMVDVALDAMREVDLLALVVDVSVKPGPGDRYLLKLLEGRQDAGDPGAEQGRSVAKPKLLPLIEQYQPRASVRGDRADLGSRRHQCRRAREALPATSAGRRAALSAGLRHRPARAILHQRDHPRAGPADDPRRAAVLDRGRRRSVREPAGEDEIIKLYCTILVERESQKPIVVGTRGRDDQGDRHRGARGAASATSTRACTSTCTSR